MKRLVRWYLRPFRQALLSTRVLRREWRLLRDGVPFGEAPTDHDPLRPEGQDE